MSIKLFTIVKYVDGSKHDVTRFSSFEADVLSSIMVIIVVVAAIRLIVLDLVSKYIKKNIVNPT